MPFFDTAPQPMSGMSGGPSIAGKIGIAQQEGYTLTKKGSAVGNTPDISAILSERPWSLPASSAPRRGGSGHWESRWTQPSLGRRRPVLCPRGVACRFQKRDSASRCVHAASQAAALAQRDGGKPL
jgi:hypothetical protein